MLAQHCFVMCLLPQFSQTVRCGTSRQLAIDTCDGGFVQTHDLSRCVVRVLAPGIHTSRFHRVGVIFAGECASGSLRDGQAACQDTPADLMHTHLPAAKKKRRDSRHKLTHRAQ